MGTFELTAKQYYAATSLDKNILVEAGAGSGKTSVLTERYLFALRRGISHHEVVAITFTEKAADEMRQRIIARYKLPEDEIWVSTIHAFCARLLRNHPLEAEVDPIFDIIDEPTAEIRRQAAIDNYFRYHLDNPTDGFKKLLNLFGIRSLHDIALQYLRDRREMRVIETLHIYETIKGWLVSDPLWIEALSLLRSININFSDRLNDKRTQILDLISKIDSHPELIGSILPLLNLSGAGRKWPAEELGKLKRGFGILKGLFKKVRPLLEWEDEIDFNEEKDINLAIITLIVEIREAYSKDKITRGELDFEDLLIKAKWLLTDTEIRSIYQTKFKQIMVDEFQDTNRLQYDILKLLSSDSDGCFLPGRLFIVGDPKQSIYRFRGGDVSIFNEIKDEFLKYDGEVIHLSDNFRSSSEIISCINNIFPQVFSGDRNRIQYVSLDPKSGTTGPKPALFVVPPSEEERRTNQAKIIQQYIRALIAGGVKPEEIAILFRGSLQIPPFEKALRGDGIPCFSYNNDLLFQQIEVYDFLNLLHFLESRDNIAALMGILRSPIVGLKDQSLLQIVFSGKMPDAGADWMLDGGERDSIRRFETTVERLRGIKDQIPINQFLNMVIEETFLDIIQLSDQARENLFQIVKLSEELSGAVTTLGGFLERVEFMISKGIQKSSAQPSEASRGVELMTIHKAKGLEFRYVIIPDLRYQPRPIPNKIAVDSGGRVTTTISRDEGGVVIPSWNHAYIKFLEREEDIAESKRLLYVAMTRAISNLVLVIDADDLEDDDGVELFRGGSWASWFRAFTNTEVFDLIKCELVPESREIENKSYELIDTVDKTDSDWVPVSEPAIKPAERGLTLSISELSSFRTCGLAHHYRYREDILITEGERRAGYGSDVGRWTHRLLQKWYPFKEDIYKLADSIEVPTEIRNRVLKLALNVLNPGIRSLFDAMPEADLELSFHMKLDNNIVEGIIDVAMFDGDGWRIIDYKTNRVSKQNIDHLVGEYKFQLESYATGLETVSGQGVRELSMIFLEAPFKIDLPWNFESKESVINEWRRIASEIGRSNAVPNPSSCPYCIFKKWCPEVKAGALIDITLDPEYSIEYEA